MFGVHLHLFLFIIFVNLFSSAYCEIPDTVLCADPECSVPISEAQGKIFYTPSEENVLGFKKGAKILIISKSKEKDGYWGAKIGTKIGFVPSKYVKEVTVWKSMDMLKYEVPTISKPIQPGNENLNKENSVVNAGKKPMNPDPSQGSIKSPLTNIIHGDFGDMSGELLFDSQNSNLKGSYKESGIPTRNTDSDFPQLDPITEIPSIVSKEEKNQQEKSETEVKVVEVTHTISHSSNPEEKSESSNSDIPETNVDETSTVGNLDSDSGERVSNEQINLGHKSSTDTEILTNASSISQKSNEKNEEVNPTGNKDGSNLVGENENQSVDSSRNADAAGGSDSKLSTNVKLEIKDTDASLEIPNEMRMHGVSNSQGGNIEIPLVHGGNDPLVLSGTAGPVKVEKKPSINVEQYAHNWQNILPKHNEEIDVQAELRSDTGTVNDNNKNSLKLGMNVDPNENLDHDNTYNVSAAVSSSSSSSGSSGGSDSDILEVSNDIYVKREDNSLKESSSPSHVIQNEIKTTEGMNAWSTQLGHASQHGMAHDDFNSPRNPDPYIHMSPGHAPYNYVRERENSNAETVPPSMIVGGPSSLGGPPSMNTINNNQESSQYIAPNSELPQVDNAKPIESLQISYRDTSSKNAEPVDNRYETNVKPPESLETVNEDTSMNSNPEQQEPTQYGKQDTTASTSVSQKYEVEKPMSGIAESVQSGNVEDAIGETFHYELPTESPVEVVTDTRDITENPSENSNLEFSTPVPPPALVTDSYEDTQDNSIQGGETDGEGGFFSNLGETVLSWVGLGSKKREPELEAQEGNPIEETLFKAPPSDFYNKENIIVPDGTCKEMDGSTINCNEVTLEENNSIWSFWLDNKTANSSSSYNTFIYLVVTAVTVLLFTLGYYFIEKFRNDGPLIAKVNRLEQELLVSSKECVILKDELTNTKEKLSLFETSSNDKIIAALQQELEESKKIRAELENNIEVLQQELDAATEAGLDLNRMLSEVLTQKGGSETLMESVEHLQAQLNNQQKIIDEMTSKLFTKTNENQELQDELTAANEKIESLEGEIEDMRGNLNVHLKDNEDIIKDLTWKNNELQLKINQMNEAKEKEVVKLKKTVAELEKKMKAISDSLKIKEEECNNLKDSVKKIKVKDGKSIDSLFEASRIKAELGQATSENASLKERLKSEEDKFAKLESKVKKLEEEIQKLRQISGDAEKEKAEAQTRLEVLSNYFKEKETQLQKELGLREAMWVQKQGDDSTIYEKIKSLEEEISNYKSQNEALKKEILDQERGLKAQITTLEKKAHENWIAARQAERKLEETKQEAAQLRNKMTLMEKNISNDLESSQHHRVGDELNGGDALSPLIHDTSSPILFPPPLPLDPNNSSLMPPGFIPPPMFMPPPPSGFMPPPPPFLPGDHRPPPLGRMSSPPLNNRFSPPPPDYAYDRMSTPPLSPSNRNYRSPNESERDRERFRHRTPTSPSFRSRNWEEAPSAGMSGFRPITSERDSRRDHKGGSNLSSGHSSDSLDKSSRHSSRV